MIKLPCAAVFPYVPQAQADTDAQKTINNIFYKLKNGGSILLKDNAYILASKFFAQAVVERLGHLPTTAIPTNAVLVPVPRSTTSTNPWPQRALAEELVALGHGTRVEPAVIRALELPKAAWARKENRARSTVVEHINSLALTQGLQPAEHVVLVDDLMTQGTQLIGCCKKLREGGHTGPIWGFTPMYTCYTCITDLKTDKMAVKQGEFSWDEVDDYPDFLDASRPRGFGLF